MTPRGIVSRETPSRRIAVVGTGTGVGKTHATRALATALALRHHTVAALKPIESGVGERTTDFDLLVRVSNVPIAAQPYAFADPVSPHLAARRAHQTVRLARVRAWVDRHAASWTLIETAGALLSPLNERQTNLDLVAALDCSVVILVAVDRLGALHDVRACILALRTALPDARVLVLLQAPPRADASTGTNAAELGRLRIAPAALPLPRAARPTAPSVQHAAARVVDTLERLVRR